MKVTSDFRPEVETRQAGDSVGHNGLRYVGQIYHVPQNVLLVKNAICRTTPQHFATP